MPLVNVAKWFNRQICVVICRGTMLVPGHAKRAPTGYFDDTNLPIEPLTGLIAYVLSFLRRQEASAKMDIAYPTELTDWTIY